MVQRKITRRTFEQKREEAEEGFKLFERTICSIVKMYDGNIHAVAEDLHDMANLDSIETYRITDEGTVTEEIPVFASRKQICDYLYIKGVFCSMNDLEMQCIICENEENLDKCRRQCHMEYSFVMHLIQDLNKRRS